LKIIPNGFFFYAGRQEINGRMIVSTVPLPVGFWYPAEDGLEHFTRDYQVLVCDPEPGNACRK
jgi:hypothetical protein